MSRPPQSLSSPASAGRTVCLGGALGDIRPLEDVVDQIVHHGRADRGDVLGVIPLTLGNLHTMRAGSPATPLPLGIRWVALTGGATIARRASQVVGRPVPPVAGRDLAWPVLERAAVDGLRVGVLVDHDDALSPPWKVMVDRLPSLVLAGTWCAPRGEDEDELSASAVAADIASAEVDILMLALDEARGHQWIAQWGRAARAKVCFAIGDARSLVPGFMPVWLRPFAEDPRRFLDRCVVQGLPRLLALRRHAHLPDAMPMGSEASSRTFAGAGEPVDVTAFVVTYNSEGDIEALLAGLRRQVGDFSLRVMVCDNNSADATVDIVRRQPDVVLVEPLANVGYARGINLLKASSGPSGQYLVLNPDLEIADDTIQLLRDAMSRDRGVGCVVPMIMDPCGRPSRSLRNEPSVPRAWGDALLGSAFGGRPSWLTEAVPREEEYLHAHPIDWATGAALLVDGATYDETGPWDERFFLYSEETDFMRRIRQAGRTIHYEPTARVWHRQGGSGSSPDLTALMIVNKVRYFKKWHGEGGARAFGAAMVVAGFLRPHQPGHKLAREVLQGRLPLSSLVGFDQMMEASPS